MRFKFIASAVVLVVALGLGELGASLVEPQVPGWYGLSSSRVPLQGHPTRLWGMVPGIRKNAGALTTIDELGIRAPIPERPRPAPRQRVVVLGDSTFFGHGVTDTQTLGAVLGVRLRSRGIDVDVVNAAVPGYSTDQTRLLLAEVIWDLDPTLLLVGNLWSDNDFDRYRDADLLKTARVYGANPLGVSALFRVVAAAVDGLQGGRGARIVTWTTSSDWPTQRTRRVPLPDYAHNLDAIARDARDRNVGVAFIAPCNRDMVRSATDESSAWATYFQAQRRVAAHHQTLTLDTLPAMKLAFETLGEDGLFLDDMHPTPAGLEVFADVVAQGLIDAGWPHQALMGVGEAVALDGLVDRMSIQALGRLPHSPQNRLFEEE